MTAPKRLISFQQVCDRENKSKSTLYREIASGRHPRPIKIGERRVAFVEAEIEALISSKMAERGERL